MRKLSLTVSDEAHAALSRLKDELEVTTIDDALDALLRFTDETATTLVNLKRYMKRS